MVTTSKFIAFMIAFSLLVIFLVYDADGFIFIIDHANLLFHEAGHVIFGIFGSTLGLYGGTLGQLVFPIVTALIFLRERAVASFAVCLLWLFEKNIRHDQRGKRTENPIPTNQSVVDPVRPTPPEASSWILGSKRLVSPPPIENSVFPLPSMGVSPNVSM
jgi:hypothetical protein